MSAGTIIGYVASTITTIYVSYGLTSQVIKNYIKGVAQNLSIAMVLTMFVSFIGWVVYGLYLHNYFVFVPNFIGMVLSGILCLQKLLPRFLTIRNRNKSCPSG